MAWILAGSKPMLCTAPLLWQVMIQFLFAFQTGEMSEWLMNLQTGTLNLGSFSNYDILTLYLIKYFIPMMKSDLRESSALLVSTFYQISKWPKAFTFHLCFHKSIQEYSPRACTFPYRRAELFWVIGASVLTSLHLGAVGSEWCWLLPWIWFNTNGCRVTTVV